MTDGPVIETRRLSMRYITGGVHSRETAQAWLDAQLTRGGWSALEGEA